MLKVHPSNFVVRGFTRSVTVAELAAALAGTGVPLVADIGSGLLRPHPLLPDEPDLQSTLRRRRRPRAGQRRQAARRAAGRAASSAAPSWSSGCAGTRSTGRCGWTRRRSRRWRPPCAGRCRRCRRLLAADLDGLRERARALRRPARRGRHRRRRRRRRGPGRRGRGARAPAARRRGRAAAVLRRPAAAAARPPVVGYVEERPHAAQPAQPAAVGRRRAAPRPCWRCPAAGLHGRDRHRGSRRPRQVRAGPRADRDGARPVGRGAPPRPDHRPRLRLDDAALGPRGSRSSTCPATSASSATCWPGSARCPAALLVVAADDGWSAQTAEHVAVLDALGRPARPARGDQGRPGRPGAGARRRARAAGRDRRWASVPGVAVSALHRRRDCRS